MSVTLAVDDADMDTGDVDDGIIASDEPIAVVNNDAPVANTNGGVIGAP